MHIDSATYKQIFIQIHLH